MRLLPLITVCGFLVSGCGTEDASSDTDAATDSTTAAPATGETSATPTTAPSETAGSAAVTTGNTDDGGATTAGNTNTGTTTSSSDETAAGSRGVSLCDNGELDAGETDVDCGGDCGACPTGSVCEDPSDCASAVCESGSCLGDAQGCDLNGVQGAPGGLGWADSYSVDGRCYCATSFDHNIGGIMVETPAGPRTVMEVCEAIGPGPGVDGHPIYNDVQCGNGPANDAGDEDWCPGRVDQGEAGCCTAGPLWDLSVFER